MTDKIRLVRGDTAPQLRCTISDETTGSVLDLTGSTIVMRFRAVGTTNVLDTLSGVIVDAVNGVVVFQWNPTTLDVDAGDYEGEIEITFALGSARVTVYDVLKFKVREDF